MTSLPPCQSCLTQHVNRVNYHVMIYSQAHIPQPVLPDPMDGHGWTCENGVMRPKWTDGEIILHQLVDILEETVAELHRSDEDDDNEAVDNSSDNEYESIEESDTSDDE